MWLFLCVMCVTVLSALFSGIRRRAEKDDHHSACQPEIELHGLDGLGEKALLAGKMPSIHIAVDKRMGAYFKFTAVTSYSAIK